MTPQIFTGLYESNKKRFIRERLMTPKEKATGIIHRICGYFEMPISDITGLSRKREFVIIRHYCIYFIRQQTTLSLKDIGLLFSGRDHSTVIYAIDTLNDLIFTDQKIKRKVALLEDFLL